MKKLMWCLMSVLGLLGTAHADLAMFKTHTFQSAAGATGNGTPLAVDNYSTVGLQVVISDTATVTFEVTSDGTNWASAVCTASGDTAGTLVTTASASAAYQCNIAGYQQFRARVSSFTGGTITVTGRATTAVLGRKGGGGGGSGVATSIANSDTLPATCTVAGIYFDTDADQNQRVNVCTATDTWTQLLETETQSLDDVCTVGCEITTAVSEATGQKVGDGTNKVSMYWDPTGGWYAKPSPLGDSLWRCWTNFNCVIYDEESAAAILTIDPDAASKNAMYQFGANYRPLKSFFLPAGYFSTDGTQCAAPAEATPVASGAKLFTIICTDNDAGRMHATFDMPEDYDGGTLLLKSAVVQTAATTGVIEFQGRAQCKGDTEALVAISSFGTEVVWTDTMTGSGAVNKATSGAITPSGTCAAGDLISLSIDIGATNTTTAMATAHILGFKVIYSSTSLSH